MKQNLTLLSRAWDHVVLQAYSTLDANAPGDASKLIDYSARLASPCFSSMNPHVDLRLVATWSRADQTYLQSGHWFGKPIEAMALDIRAACDRAAGHTLYIGAVVPVGQAWNRAIARVSRRAIPTWKSGQARSISGRPTAITPAPSAITSKRW